MIKSIAFMYSVRFGDRVEYNIYGDDNTKLIFDKDSRFIRVEIAGNKYLVPMTNVGAIEVIDNER